MIRPVPLPPPVGPGARVGVAALSGPVDPDRLDAGLAALASLGYRPVEARNLRSRHGLFAGSDAERVEAFHELADRRDIEAIVFARGGWGVNRLLDRLDWQRLAERPRAYVGYSDLTPFLSAVIERIGCAAFHGPMVAADLARGLDADEAASFVGALAGRFPEALELAWCDPGESVEAPLMGGCLSLLTAALGTPAAPDLDGSLLFLEETDEPPFRVDRMLTHLGLSGTLPSIRGLVVGHLRAESREELSAWNGEVTLSSVLRETASAYPWPLALGLDAGHARPNRTLPLGMLARLEPATRRLVVGLDAAVAPSRQLPAGDPS